MIIYGDCFDLNLILTLTDNSGSNGPCFGFTTGWMGDKESGIRTSLASLFDRVLYWMLCVWYVESLTCMIYRLWCGRELSDATNCKCTSSTLGWVGLQGPVS